MPTYDIFNLNYDASTFTLYYPKDELPKDTAATITPSTDSNDVLVSGSTFTVGRLTYTYDGTATVVVDGVTINGFTANLPTGKSVFVAVSGTLPVAPHRVALSDVVAVDPNDPTVGEFNVGTGQDGCFMFGTRLRTPTGDVAVESLKAGDLVLTASGAARPIRWIGSTLVSRFGTDPVHVLPIRIKAGALRENVPSRDLLVSPGHAVLVGDVLAHAGALVNGVSIVRELDAPLVFTYYHVELDAHDLVIAEGAEAESFLEAVAEMNMDNWSERATLTAPAPTREMAYPRVKAIRQLPRHVRSALSSRLTGLPNEVSAAA